jgi:DNA-binding NarL/FixJ family response regulator
VPTLSEYLHEFSQQAGIQVSLDVSEEHSHIRIAPEVEVQFVRIVQEALNNIRKHSGARTAQVRLWQEGDEVVVAIEDKGAGIDPPDPRRMDIVTMASPACRSVRSRWGRLTIRSTPEQAPRWSCGSGRPDTKRRSGMTGKGNLPVDCASCWWMIMPLSEGGSPPSWRPVPTSGGGQAEDGVQAVAKAAELMPDLILMDIQMPGMDGLEATRQIKAAHPYLKIVMLTAVEEDRNLFEAVKAGAHGYLLKSMQPDEFLARVRGIAQGEAPISHVMAAKILEEFGRHVKGKPPDDPASKLTPREHEVLQLLTQGCPNKEIANTLGVSEGTVKNHLKHILAKLHLQNRVQAAAYAAPRRNHPDEAPRRARPGIVPDTSIAPRRLRHEPIDGSTELTEVSAERHGDTQGFPWAAGR